MKNIYIPTVNKTGSIRKTLDRFLKLFALPVILAFVFSNILSAQVAVDNTSFGSSVTTSPITVSHTTGTGSDRLMLVGVSTRDRTVSGVTYRGIPLTLVGAQTSNNNAKTA